MVIAEPLYWFGHSLYKGGMPDGSTLTKYMKLGIIHFMLYPNAAMKEKC